MTPDPLTRLRALLTTWQAVPAGVPLLQGRDLTDHPDRVMTRAELDAIAEQALLVADGQRHAVFTVAERAASLPNPPRVSIDLTAATVYLRRSPIQMQVDAIDLLHALGADAACEHLAGSGYEATGTVTVDGHAVRVVTYYAAARDGGDVR
jgi:hypothetical protein